MNNSGNGIRWRSEGNGGDTTLTARSERHNRGAIHVVYPRSAIPAETNAAAKMGESARVSTRRAGRRRRDSAVSLAAEWRDEPMAVERRRHDSG
jgi:hypothetical protein